MAKIVNLFSSADEDMKEYQKKIRRHRIAQLLKGGVLLLLLLLAFLGFRYYQKNKIYTGYTVAASVERSDTLTTRYASFGGKILKYSRDGISYTDIENSILFSITYTMQDPILTLCEKTGAVADKNGTQIYVFDQEKQLGQITTLLPIRQITVSDQGIVAVLMEENNNSKLEIYLPDGTLLGDGIFALEDVGYPLNISLSHDGTKLAISFARIAGSRLGSSVAVYNFDQVGENYVDHLVFAQNYEDAVATEVHYFDAGTLAVLGDGILSIYQGAQIPELVREIPLEETVKSVYYGADQVGLVFETDQGNLLKLYDLKGNLNSEIMIDLDYENIRIFQEGVVAYRATELAVYGENGKERCRQTLETPVTELFTTKSASQYLLIYTNETQLIKLH